MEPPKKTLTKLNKKKRVKKSDAGKIKTENTPALGGFGCGKRGGGVEMGGAGKKTASKHVTVTTGWGGYEKGIP